jgi:riboflavin kinase / FMN adenylyltransferase
MQHLHSLDDIRLENTWLSIGIFDGVHRGHQVILDELVASAHAAGGFAVVLTFSPHPAIVLGGKTGFRCLTTTDERAALLGSFGVDIVITQTFNRSFADQTAEEFMQHIVRSLGLRGLIVGYDTALGRGREGDAARLAKIGLELGYTVKTVPPLKDDAGIISSTRIRSAVAAGRVGEAASDLGRAYSIIGPVVHGDGRGHTIQVPTANIQIPSEKLMPAFGIYACRAWVDGSPFAAATSIGIRPTFYQGDPPAPTIEAHLLDFQGDLYGRYVKLEFVQYLRPEQKYSTLEALMAQIHEDIAQTRMILVK